MGINGGWKQNLSSLLNMGITMKSLQHFYSCLFLFSAWKSSWLPTNGLTSISFPRKGGDGPGTWIRYLAQLPT
ncbi:hypothetical protein ADIS_4271 [Lunatimonas lonarensis]|uniref:Uncharacterized protein n=1 Tax=Lunatimonas lonarensis TaxID=1232681 RepID=R7ZLY5_9BACT|nr:hypothetical protein ADIS_4271 [Lunatimonas lonarensis]